ncbi:MAG: cytochrome c oxidase accessory protein CcoG [Pseudomonadota bacterium]
MDQIDEDAPLYANRKGVYPRAVSGWYRRLKWILMTAMLAIYYVTPWIRFPRGDALPDQAVLVDLANRRFFFFWIEIWPNEFYYVAGMLIMAGLGLFLFTSAMGRVWCGYACPQTVWVDLFQHVERAVDGDRNAQIRLERAPWGPRKIAKRLSKWSIWLVIALATGGAWVFYFADAPTLMGQLLTGAAPSAAYITIAILTFTTFTLGGFMREQVCIYMCPWPRIQGAMLDQNSLTITYKHWRGEPRGKHRKRAEAEGLALGDCIDCDACVNVCPTGVDIRDGDNIGCITCGLCIDACDEMMAKTGRPRGLIDYCTLLDAKRETAGEAPVAPWRRVIRPRTLLYFTLWAGIGVFMVVHLFMRDAIDISVLRDRNPQFVTLSDGSVRNGYTFKVSNKELETGSFRVAITGAPGLRLLLQDDDTTGFVVPADKQRALRAFVIAPAGWRPPEGVAPGAESVPIRVWAENLITRERTSYETSFYGVNTISGVGP